MKPTLFRWAHRWYCCVGGKGAAWTTDCPMGHGHTPNEAFTSWEKDMVFVNAFGEVA